MRRLVPRYRPQRPIVGSFPDDPGGRRNLLHEVGLVGRAQLSGDRYALAVGDAWVLNDPISGQGANLGSLCAFALADLISAGGPYDEEFCRRAEKEVWRPGAAVGERAK